MEDLFQPTSKRIPRKKQRTTERGRGGTSDEESSYGGHNLRTVITSRQRDDNRATSRPRSELAKPTAQTTLTGVLETNERLPEARSPAKRSNVKSAAYDDDDEDDDDNDDDADEDDDDDDDEDDDVDIIGNDGEAIMLQHTSAVTQPASGTSMSSPSDQSMGSPTRPSHSSQPFQLTSIKDDSKLGRAAAELFETIGYSLKDDLAWQSGVANDAAKMKSFRIEATQQVDLVPFAFMRPSSPYVQILHSVATYSVRGGDSDLHGRDFGFVGDRTNLRIPSPVVVDDSLWKWMTKTIGMDVPPLQAYYANPANARKLYYDTASGGSDTTIPRMLYLPPPFLAFCLEEQRTPFELHEFIARYATREQSEITVQACTVAMDWCIAATQAAKASALSTSILAIVLATAPSDDDTFLRWLYKVDHTKSTTAGQPTGSTAPPLVHAGPTTTAAPQPHPANPPPADVWTQMAKSITSSFASAAAAIKPPASEDSGTSYEFGGRLYDKFQMAAVQGFAHVADVSQLPAIWGLFQYTKHLVVPLPYNTQWAMAA